MGTACRDLVTHMAPTRTTCPPAMLIVERPDQCEGAMRNRRRSVPLVFVVWLVVGVVVAASHHYFDGFKTIGAILSAIVAVVLWPLILLGVKFTITA